MTKESLVDAEEYIEICLYISFTLADAFCLVSGVFFESRNNCLRNVENYLDQTSLVIVINFNYGFVILAL